MESTEIHDEFTESPRGVSMESTIFQKVSLESMWTIHRVLTESSWSPWKPMGECKVLVWLANKCFSRSRVFFVAFFEISPIVKTQQKQEQDTRQTQKHDTR